MSIFRIRDYLSVLLYRLFRGLFGSFGRRVRVVWPLRLTGLKHIHLGDDVSLAQGACILAVKDFSENPKILIGNSVKIGEFSHFVCSDNIRIGSSVLMAHRVFISDCGHEFEDIKIPVVDQGLRKGSPVTIGDGTWLGENVSVISAGIGRNCVIGANSVVTREIPDYCVAAGVPAVVIKRYCISRKAWFPTDKDGNFREF